MMLYLGQRRKMSAIHLLDLIFPGQLQRNVILPKLIEIPGFVKVDDLKQNVRQ